MTETGQPIEESAANLFIGLEQLGTPKRSTLVYVGGPLGSVLRCNRQINIARAEFVGVALCSLGFTPVIPHKLYADWEAYGWEEEFVL